KNIDFYFATSQFSQLLTNKRIVKVELLHQLSWYPIQSGTTNSSNNPPLLDLGTSSLSMLQTGVTFANAFQAGYTPFVEYYGCGLNFLASGLTIGKGLGGGTPISSVNLGEIFQFSGQQVGQMSSKYPWRYEDLTLFEASAGINRIAMHYEFGAATGWAGEYFLGYVALRVSFCEEQRVAYAGSAFGSEFSIGGPDYVLGANSAKFVDTHNVINPTLSGGEQYTVTVSAPDVGDLNGAISTGVSLGAAANPYPTLNAVRELSSDPVHTGIKLNLTQTEGEVFSRETTHVLPQLSLHTSGGPVTEVHVYGRQARGQVFGSVTASQNVQDGTLGLFGARAQGLTLPGGSGNYVSTPDNAALDIVGDIDLRADIQTNDWTANGGLVTKWGAAGVRSYEFAINPDGTLSMVWSTDGTSVQFANSTIPVPALDGQRLAVRATLDVDNGAAGKTVQFFT